MAWQITGMNLLNPDSFPQSFIPLETWPPLTHGPVVDVCLHRISSKLATCRRRRPSKGFPSSKPTAGQRTREGKPGTLRTEKKAAVTERWRSDLALFLQAWPWSGGTRQDLLQYLIFARWPGNNKLLTVAC